jgi:hypothetical protein
LNGIFGIFKGLEWVFLVLWEISWGFFKGIGKRLKMGGFWLESFEGFLVRGCLDWFCWVEV